VNQLVDTLGERRLLEARLTGGFAYGPMFGSSRGGAPPSKEGAIHAAADAVKKSAASKHDKEVAARARGRAPVGR
jgi:hypothetical protein